MAYEANWGVETAEAYKWRIVLDWQRERRRSHWTIWKADRTCYGLEYNLTLAHKKYRPEFHDGASIYHPDEAIMRVIEAPLSILNQTFSPIVADHDFYARSIFAKGKALFSHSAEQCLRFVKWHYPKGIIVGVENPEQLQELIRLDRMPPLENSEVAALRSFDIKLETRGTEKLAF